MKNGNKNELKLLNMHVLETPIAIIQEYIH